VWADTLLRAEQQHLMRLLVWAAMSIVIGTAMLVTVAARRLRSPLLEQFAVQTVVWGLAEAALGGLHWRSLTLRDVAAAARLERAVWFGVGLGVGILLMGAGLAIAGWRGDRRFGAVGAGIAICVQALALLILGLQFVSAISL
jgi:hypothetical protein